MKPTDKLTQLNVVTSNDNLPQIIKIVHITHGLDNQGDRTFCSCNNDCNDCGCNNDYCSEDHYCDDNVCRCEKHCSCQSDCRCNPQCSSDSFPCVTAG